MTYTSFLYIQFKLTQEFPYFNFSYKDMGVFLQLMSWIKLKPSYAASEIRRPRHTCFHTERYNKKAKIFRIVNEIQPVMIN